MTDDPKQTQAQRIYAKFGGHNKLALAIGRSRQAVTRWNYPASRRGSGGLVPRAAVHLIQEAAVRLGIVLTAEDWKP